MADLESTFNPTDQSSPAFYGPSQTALLIMDFHQFIVDRAGDRSESATQTAGELRQWALAKGITVIHALIDIDDKPFPTRKNHQRIAGLVETVKKDGGYDEPEYLSPVGRFHYHFGISAADVVTKADSAEELTFKRPPGHVSALESHGLREFLEKRSIRSLILCGLSTSGCTLRTANAANEAKYVVTVISDACADGNQDVHDMLTSKILPMTAHVTTAEEFEKGYDLVQSET